MLLKLRSKIALILLVILLPAIGIPGGILYRALLRAEREAQRLESLFVREAVLRDLRSHTAELEEMGLQSLYALEDPRSGLPPCRREKCFSRADLALLVDSRGTLIWSEGLPPHENIPLPSWEILRNLKVSKDLFLFGQTSQETFLLGASWKALSGKDEEKPGEVLFFGTKATDLSPCKKESPFFGNLESLSEESLDFRCFFLGTLKSSPAPAIVHEIDKSNSPLVFLPSEHGERAYFVLRDWNGTPEVLLSFSPPRNITALMAGSLRKILFITPLAGGLLFGGIFLLLRHSVIRRLRRLASFLQMLIRENRFAPSSQRIPRRGNDEISLVESSINALLDTIEDVRKEERHNEQQLLALAENIPGAVYRSRMDRQFTKIFVSDNFEQLTGYSPKDILGNQNITITDITHPEDRVFLYTTFWKQLEEEGAFSINYRILRSDGKYIWVHDCGQVTQDELKGERFIDGVMLDMTDLKHTEMRLQEEKNRYKELTDSLPQTIFETDLQGNIRFMNRNGFSSFGYLPKDLQEKQISWLHLFEDEDKEKALRCMKRLLEENREIATELTARTAAGKVFPAALYINPVRQAGETRRLLGILIDLSAQKTMEEKLRFLSMHDSLTGLYNRAFFEEEMNRMETRRFDPLGAIMCDLDGLKLVNDIMGHAAGDRLLIAAACILRQTFRSSDVIARVGGDEFAVLLPHCPEEQMLQILGRLRRNMETYNAGNGSIPISISVGSASRGSSEDFSSVEALVNEADTKMYRQKLRQSAQVRKNFVEKLHNNFCNTAMPNSRGHQHHAQTLMLGLWKHLDNPESEKTNVGLFALFHDIGYIGIPLEIPAKPGPLNEEEWQIIHRHPEIGHRIALSSPDLSPVAEWILKHHERPDGKGYPLGLQREEIPKACLLFALVDTYTCMINHRPFQEARSPEEAFEEIRRCRGTQFDPDYTDIFLEFMKDHPELHRSPSEEPGK